MPSSAEALVKAKTLLNLSDRSTLKDIKHQYKALMKQWHPDKHKEDQEHAKEIATEINSAYELIMQYCQETPFDLSEETLRKNAQTPAEWWEARFGFKKS